MTPPSSKKAVREDSVLDGAIVMAFVAFVILLVRSAGFSALSDDDYARLVIAQEFAQNPRLDPSGTSWLPFPFLLTGSAMVLFGASMQVGLWTQFAATVGGAWLLFAVSGMWGAGRWGRLLGTALCCLTPTAALLEAAAVPGFVTAALLTFAFAACRPERPLQSGLCLFLACASRYEAWAPSFAATLFFLWDAKNAKREAGSALASIFGAVLAVAFPILWMVYGALYHHDALFFVKRVVDYKAALGDSLPSWTEALSGYPRLLLVAEPELTVSALLVSAALGIARLLGERRWSLSPLKSALSNAQARPFWLYGVLLLALIGGAARGGAPTHHPERALLSIWLALGLLLGKGLERCFDGRRTAFLGLGAAALATLSSLSVRNQSSFQRQPLAHREAEETVGRFIQKHAPSEAVALALPDYGYFAVMAAAGNPARFSILESHDPRKAVAGEDPLRAWLEHPAQCAYVTTRDRPHITPRVLAIHSDVMFAREMGCVPRATSTRNSAKDD